MLPPLARDVTACLDCPVAAAGASRPKPAGTARRREDNRTGPPAPADPKVHATWSGRTEQTRGHRRIVRDTPMGLAPGAARRSRPRPPDRGPSTVDARTEDARVLVPLGSHTVRVGVGRGSPLPFANTAKPKLRDVQREAMGTGGSARPSTRTTPRHLTSPPPDTSGLRPRDPGSTVSPPRPRDRASKNRGRPPVLPQDAPTTAKRRTTEPARVVVRVRITTEAVTLLLAPHERARA